MADTPTEAELRIELDALRRRHTNLDKSIQALESESDGGLNQLQMRRLKKEKLQIKDRIAILEDNILPDIIA